jgi:hypothetical protein
MQPPRKLSFQGTYMFETTGCRTVLGSRGGRVEGVVLARSRSRGRKRRGVSASCKPGWHDEHVEVCTVVIMTRESKLDSLCRAFILYLRQAQAHFPLSAPSFVYTLSIRVRLSNIKSNALVARTPFIATNIYYNSFPFQ